MFFFKKLRNTEIWKFEKKIIQRLPYSFPMPLVARKSYLSKILTVVKNLWKKIKILLKTFLVSNFFTHQLESNIFK